MPEDATECPYCGAEITNGKRIASILVGVMLAVGAVAAYFAYTNHQVALQQEREQAIRDSLAHLDAIMRAPEIDLDSTGCYTECPISHNGLEVVLTTNSDEMLTKVVVNRDGQFLQTLIDSPDGDSGVSPSQEGNSLVYYLDANFDGYVDIWIGDMHGYRTSSMLFLWDNAAGKFLTVTIDGKEESLFSCDFYPQSGDVMMTVPGNMWTSQSLYKWSGSNLEAKSGLYTMYFKNTPDDHFYTLYDGKTNEAILRTDQRTDLPDEWLKYAPDQPEYEYAEEAGDEVYGENDGYYDNETSSNSYSSGARSQSNNVPRWVVSAEERVEEDANELVAMVRAGQINPMNVMRIRQAVESNLPQLVNYYQEQGNYGKVMYYQQKAIAFDQIFRALQM